MTVSTPVTGYITRIVFLSCEAGQHTSSTEGRLLAHASGWTRCAMALRSSMWWGLTLE